MDINFTYNQRQFVFELLNKAFVNYKILDGKRVADVYGPTFQTILREALHTYCFKYPLKPEIIEEESINSEKKKVKTTTYKFTITLELPIFGDKMVLEEEILKAVLERR
jgi:hypothetical protein